MFSEISERAFNRRADRLRAFSRALSDHYAAAASKGILGCELCVRIGGTIPDAHTPEGRSLAARIRPGAECLGSLSIDRGEGGSQGAFYIFAEGDAGLEDWKRAFPDLSKLVEIAEEHLRKDIYLAPGPTPYREAGWLWLLFASGWGGVAHSYSIQGRYLADDDPDGNRVERLGAAAPQFFASRLYFWGMWDEGAAEQRAPGIYSYEIKADLRFCSARLLEEIVQHVDEHRWLVADAFRRVEERCEPPASPDEGTPTARPDSIPSKAGPGEAKGKGSHTPPQLGEPDRARPVWDSKTMSITFDGKTTQIFSRGDVDGQAQILNAFEARNWQSKIRSPSEDRKFIADTYNNLNKTMARHEIGIKFRKSNLNLLWERVNATEK